MVEVAAIVAGWLTPTSLFVLLNIVIATIFFTSAFGIGTHHAGHTTKKSAADDHHRRSESGGNPQLLRAPSLFSRVTSFNFSTHHYSNYHHHHHSDDQAGHDPAPPAFARSRSFLSRVASFNFCRAQAQPDPVHNVSVVAQEAVANHDDDDDGGVRKEGSETDNGDESRGEKMVMTEKEENEREGEAKKKKKAVVTRKKAKTAPFRGADDEVDAKADDFINKFKQQLKLQRLESLLRYRSSATVTANAT